MKLRSKSAISFARKRRTHPYYRVSVKDEPNPISKGEAHYKDNETNNVADKIVKQVEPSTNLSKINDKSITNQQDSEAKQVFPMELLLKIIKSGSTISSMMKLNRSYYLLLAPFLYQNIHCIITLTKNDKMILNDLCAVTLGPDPHDAPFNSFKYYRRLQQAAAHEYEFLETTSFKHPSKPKLKDKDQIVVTKLDEIINIVTMMNDPDSLGSRYIQKLSIDVHILDGYAGLLTDEQIIGGTSLKKHCIDTNSHFIQTQDELAKVATSNSDCFITERSQDASFRDILGDYVKVYTPRDQPLTTLKNKYPENVYLKELFNIARCYDAQKSGKRAKLSSIENTEQLQKLDIFQFIPPAVPALDVLTRYGVIPEGADHRLYLLLSLSDLSTVNIADRRFSKAHETQTIIGNIINAITSDFQGSENMDRTLFFTGYEDAFIHTARYEDHVDYRPMMTLVRK